MSETLCEQMVIYNTNKKKLGIYIIGMILCLILTLISFMTVLIMYTLFSKTAMLAIIFVSASIQFMVQVIFFLQLNAKNEQSRMNLISFAFTMVILSVLVGCSLWILWGLHYRMMN